MRAFSHPTFYWITSLRHCHLRKYEISFCLFIFRHLFLSKNGVQIHGRPFSLTLYAALPEVAVKIPMHAFNSPMLSDYLTKSLCTAIQAWNVQSLFRCTPAIRLFLRRCESFYNCQIPIPCFPVNNQFFPTVDTACPWLNPAVFQRHKINPNNRRGRFFVYLCRKTS